MPLINSNSFSFGISQLICSKKSLSSFFAGAGLNIVVTELLFAYWKTSWLTSIGISHCPTRTEIFPIASIDEIAFCASISLFAPGITIILFWPVASTHMGATPLAPLTNCI